MTIGGWWERNPGDYDRARAMYDAGLSTGAIGKAIGCGKNAICGISHRYNWPVRVKAETTQKVRKPRPSRAKKAGPVTLAPFTSSPPVVIAMAKKIAAPEPTVRKVRQSNRQCEWLVGDKPFKRCSDRAVFGYPYCEAHCRRAYVNWRGAALDEVAA
jgi:hypothetical protein